MTTLWQQTTIRQQTINQQYDNIILIISGCKLSQGAMKTDADGVAIIDGKCVGHHAGTKGAVGVKVSVAAVSCFFAQLILLCFLFSFQYFTVVRRRRTPPRRVIFVRRRR